MRARISKRFTFEAAHMLPNHDGKCRRLHGHSYKLIVELDGKIKSSGPKEGMVVDFADVKEVWKRDLEPLLDHQYLNETLPFVTTAENIAWWIAQVLNSAKLPVRSVTVWETETSSAQVHYSEVWGNGQQQRAGTHSAEAVPSS